MGGKTDSTELKSNWSNFDASASIAKRNAFSVSTKNCKNCCLMNFAQLTEDLDIFDIRHIRHIFQALPFSLCLPFIFLFRSDSNILDSAFIWFDIVFIPAHVKCMSEADASIWVAASVVDVYTNMVRSNVSLFSPRIGCYCQYEF